MQTPTVAHLGPESPGGVGEASAKHAAQGYMIEKDGTIAHRPDDQYFCRNPERNTLINDRFFAEELRGNWRLPGNGVRNRLFSDHSLTILKRLLET